MSNPLNWESREVKNYLINDEKQLAAVQGMTGDELRVYVLGNNAPAELYASFDRFPVSTWGDVDWDAVAERINDI